MRVSFALVYFFSSVVKDDLPVSRVWTALTARPV